MTNVAPDNGQFYILIKEAEEVIVKIKNTEKEKVDELIKKFIEKINIIEAVKKVIEEVMSIKTLDSKDEVEVKILINKVKSSIDNKDDEVELLEFLENVIKNKSNNVVKDEVLAFIVKEMRKKYPEDKLLEFIARILGNELLGIAYRLFESGEKIKDNNKVKFECYKKSAELGHNEATRKVGDCYEEGIGVDKDVNKALDYYNLAEREKEYYYNNLKVEFSRWKNHNFKSNQTSIIAVIICLFSIVIGVFLFISDKSKIGNPGMRNIISTTLIGSGSTITLAGSLTSLKTLFKEFSGNNETITNVRDLVKTLAGNQPSEPINEKIVSKFQFNLDELRTYEKLDPLYFIGQLNYHMQCMLICRTILISLMSIILLILTLVSVSVLVFHFNDDVFRNMIIVHLSFSSFSLWCTISIRFCVHLFIPRVVEQDRNNMKAPKYESEIKIYKIWKKKNVFEKIIFIIFFPVFILIGLVPLDKKLTLKRINVRDSELEGINRIIFGLPIIITV